MPPRNLWSAYVSSCSDNKTGQSTMSFEEWKRQLKRKNHG